MDQVKHRDMWEDFKLQFAGCRGEKLKCYWSDIHTTPGDAGNAISQLFSITFFPFRNWNKKEAPGCFWREEQRNFSSTWMKGFLPYKRERGNDGQKRASLDRFLARSQVVWDLVLENLLPLVATFAFVFLILHTCELIQKHSSCSKYYLLQYALWMNMLFLKLHTFP